MGKFYKYDDRINRIPKDEAWLSFEENEVVRGGFKSVYAAEDEGGRGMAICVFNLDADKGRAASAVFDTNGSYVAPDKCFRWCDEEFDALAKAHGALTKKLRLGSLAYECGGAKKAFGYVCVPEPHAIGVVELDGDGGRVRWPAFAEDYIDYEDMGRAFGGDLDAGQAGHAVLQVAKAISTFQLNEGAHRDIKASNLKARIDEDGRVSRVMVIDLGSAHEYHPDASRPSDIVRSRGWTAPELEFNYGHPPIWLDQRDLDRANDLKSSWKLDVYSLGVLLAYLRTYHALGGAAFWDACVQVGIVEYPAGYPSRIAGVPVRKAVDLMSILNRARTDASEDDERLAEIILASTEPHPFKRLKMQELILRLEEFCGEDRGQEPQTASETDATMPLITRAADIPTETQPISGQDFLPGVGGTQRTVVEPSYQINGKEDFIAYAQGGGTKTRVPQAVRHRAHRAVERPPFDGVLGRLRRWRRNREIDALPGLVGPEFRRVMLEFDDEAFRKYMYARLNAQDEKPAAAAPDGDIALAGSYDLYELTHACDEGSSNSLESNMVEAGLAIDAATRMVRERARGDSPVFAVSTLAGSGDLEGPQLPTTLIACDADAGQLVVAQCDWAWGDGPVVGNARYLIKAGPSTYIQRGIPDASHRDAIRGAIVDLVETIAPRISIVGVSGVTRPAEVLACFELELTGNTYIVYTFHEVDSDRSETLHCSKVIEGESGPKLDNVEDEAWPLVQEVLREMIRGESEGEPRFRYGLKDEGGIEML